MFAFQTKNFNLKIVNHKKKIKINTTLNLKKMSKLIMQFSIFQFMTIIFQKNHFFFTKKNQKKNIPLLNCREKSL